MPMPLSPRQVKILFLVIGVFLVLALLVFLGRRPEKGKEVTLVFWGLEDPRDAFSDLIDRFSQETGMKIQYVSKSESSYEEELLDALASGRGPDIVSVPNTWLLKHIGKLQPAPTDLLSAKTAEEFYPDVVTHDFTSGGRVYALPLAIDTLALFYNRSLFDQAGVPFPPKTWEEFVLTVPQLAKVDRAGIIQQAAAALGTGGNVRHAADLLSLLMLQSGSTMVDTKSWAPTFQRVGEGGKSPGGEALQFYTRFSRSEDRLYTWNSDERDSLDSFSQGRVAMYFGYARDIAGIRSRAPRLEFRISSMPQPEGVSFRIDYPNYWGYGVTRVSRHPREAWQFITWLSELDQAREYMRETNRPPARRELIQEVFDDRILGVFSRQALTAESWYQPDPASVVTIFNDTIESVNFGRQTPQEAVKKAADQLQILYQRYRQ